ncbi:MAG: PEP/pyruvate-binding domain-containing protein [Thermoleophilia bacterium]
MSDHEKNTERHRAPSLSARLWLDLRDPDSIEAVSVSQAGGKAANLARLIRLGLSTPSAVVLTTDAWNLFLREAGIDGLLEAALNEFQADPEAVDGPARRIAALINGVGMPALLDSQIADAYRDLFGDGEYGIAIRSSGSCEDSAAASFSGMLSTVLGVRDIDAVNRAVRKCWLSGFNVRSLRYLARMGLDPHSMGMALIFQRMVQARSSGVLFTADPATGDSRTAVLEAAFGYGAGVVSGNISPDFYRINKATLEIAHRDARPQEYYYAADGSRQEVEPERRQASKLSDEEVRQLVGYGITAERELGAPQDIEWCRGRDGLVLLQTRPVTGLEKLSLRQKTFTRPEIVMVRGIGVSPRIGWGEVLIVDSDAGGPLPAVRDRVVLMRCLTQDLAAQMKDAAAVVTDGGGATSHGANILREFQVPCVVGTKYALAVMHDGDIVTVDGWRGLVLDGIGPRVQERDFGPEQLVPTRTTLMTTINVPESAEKAAAIADGVISFRNDYLLLQGGVHPARLLKSGQGEVLTNAVCQALMLVARAFTGKQVWYKSLDAPTDEFRRLRGGENEPLERNPLLGWRGIGRELENPALLRAEYEAVRRAVEGGCDNLGIKVPFIRGVDDYERAREIAVAVGLKPHETVAFGASIETPATVLTLDGIIKAGVDFLSVGVNDLTMCCLGVDRESERVADRFDPTHPAVLWLLEEIARQRRGKTFVAAAGDIALSPGLIGKLVEFGYDAMGISLPYLGTVRGQVARLEEG